MSLSFNQPIPCLCPSQRIGCSLQDVRWECVFPSPPFKEHRYGKTHENTTRGHVCWVFCPRSVIHPAFPRRPSDTASVHLELFTWPYCFLGAQLDRSQSNRQLVAMDPTGRRLRAVVLGNAEDAQGSPILHRVNRFSPISL